MMLTASPPWRSVSYTHLQLHRLGDVDDHPLEKVLALVLHVPALVDDPAVAVLAAHPVLHGAVLPLALEVVAPHLHQGAVVGVDHLQKLVVKALADLLPGEAEHLQELVADVEEAVPGVVVAAVVGPRQGVVEEVQLPVLLLSLIHISLTAEGARRKGYALTPAGRRALLGEYRRLKQMVEDGAGLEGYQ